MSLSVAPRMWWMIQHALREVIHLRFAWMMSLTTLVLIAGVSVLRDFNFGAGEARFLCDYTEATLALWGGMIAIILNLTMVQGGMDRGTWAMSFMRGARRHEWLLSRWVAVGVALAWLVLLGYLTLGVLLHRYAHGFSVFELMMAGGRMFLRLLLVSSFTLTACVVTRGFLMASGLALGLTLAAQLTTILEWAGQHGGTTAQWGWKILGWVVPAFHVLDGGTKPLAALVYAVGYAALYALVACAIFSRREI